MVLRFPFLNVKILGDAPGISIDIIEVLFSFSVKPYQFHHLSSIKPLFGFSRSITELKTKIISKIIELRHFDI